MPVYPKVKLNSSFKIAARRAAAKSRKSSVSKMLSMLLVQNQQIIMQQQNMMFMVLNQHQQQGNSSINSRAISGNGSNGVSSPSNNSAVTTNCQPQQQTTNPTITTTPHLNTDSTTTMIPLSQTIPQNNSSLSPTSTAQVPISDLIQSEQPQQTQHIQNNHHHQQQRTTQLNNIHIHHQQTQQQIHSQQQQQHIIDHQQHQQQHAETHIHLLDPLSGPTDLSDPPTDMSSVIGISENDSDILFNPSEHTTLVYNPQADIGPVTPYKDQQSLNKYPGFQSMSDYSAASSATGSLRTPRLYNNAGSNNDLQQPDDRQHQQMQPVSQIRPAVSSNVVKNLAQSFKSPVRTTLNNINVQFVSNSKQNLKDNKAKVIQQLRISNISKFLRQVHPETQQNY